MNSQILIIIKQKISGKWYSGVSSTCSSEGSQTRALIQLQNVCKSSRQTNVLSFKEILHAGLGSGMSQYLGIGTQPNGQVETKI